MQLSLFLVSVVVVVIIIIIIVIITVQTKLLKFGDQHHDVFDTLLHTLILQYP